MPIDAQYHEFLRLTPVQETQWQADLDALSQEIDHHELHPLRIGDQYLELKKRWGNKAAVLAREAGLSPYVARQRARIARAISPASPLRHLALPFSILRLLAPLPDPQPWAEQAVALQQRGELRVRPFAHLLEDAGLRKRRPRRRQRYHTCQHCRHTVPEGDPLTVYVRVPEGEGWFCETRCAVEHLLEHAGLDMQVEWVQIDPDTGRPLSPSSTEKRDSGSPTATPAPESSRPESAQADFASTDRDFNPGVNPAPNPGGPPAPRPAVQQTEDGVKVVLPGGLVIMTRRRPT